MRSSRTRSFLVSAFVLVLVGIGWFYLAPTQIGGSTNYVITHGISMEPLIHAGDLVLVRPESNYRVGQVVAYHSTLLHTVVLHRIIRIEDGHYVFKGDNNHFIDPTHPTRSLLVGRMWLHIPGGGVVLNWLHKPWLAAVLFGAVAAFLLFGGERRRRRRDRGRRHGSASRRARTALPVMSAAPRSAGPMSHRNRFVALCSGALVFAVLSVVAFVLPANTTVVVRQPFTQTLRFSYRASVPPSAVYPSGTVSTGDPVYIQLVHLLTVTAAYRLTSTAPNQLHGTIGIRGTLSNSSGWSRSFWLTPPTPFTGAAAGSAAQVNLRRFESLANRISAQIGAASTSSYSLTVAPVVKVVGRIAGQPVSATYSPTLNLALGAPQLLGGSSAVVPSGSSTSSQLSLVHSTPGAATTVHSSANTIAGVRVEVLRWLALVALALCGLGAFMAYRRERESPPDPSERINSRYKHLIVAVEPMTPDPNHPPIDVSSIDALAQLAERSERLILHDHREDVDNYLIDDQGTLFRFRAPRVTAVNGTAGMNGASTANGTVGVGADAASAGAAAGPGTATGGNPAGAGESSVTDPAADAAAAILSSAAAKLSAAAAMATASTVGTSTSATSTSGTSTSGTSTSGTSTSGTSTSGTSTSGTSTSTGTGPGGNGQGMRAAPGREGIDSAPAAGAEPTGSAPAAEPTDSAPAAEPAGLRSRPAPDLPVVSAEARGMVGADSREARVPTSGHWSNRPEVRAGFAIGPLALCFLAWRRLRARRRRLRGDDAEEAAKRSWTTRNLPRR